MDSPRLMIVLDIRLPVMQTSTIGLPASSYFGLTTLPSTRFSNCPTTLIDTRSFIFLHVLFMQVSLRYWLYIGISLIPCIRGILTDNFLSLSSMRFSSFSNRLDCNLYWKGGLRDGGSAIGCCSTLDSFSTGSSSSILCFEGERGYMIVPLVHLLVVL